MQKMVVCMRNTQTEKYGNESIGQVQIIDDLVRVWYCIETDGTLW